MTDTTEARDEDLPEIRDIPLMILDNVSVKLAVDTDESRVWAPWVIELSKKLADDYLAPGWYLNTFGELLDAGYEEKEKEVRKWKDS